MEQRFAEAATQKSSMGHRQWLIWSWPLFAHFSGIKWEDGFQTVWDLLPGSSA